MRTYFGFQGTPANYLIDREGNAVGGAIGYRDWESPVAQKLIERLLEGETSSSGEEKKKVNRQGKAG